jgi:DNA-binding SARP family transcriptional activator
MKREILQQKARAINMIINHYFQRHPGVTQFQSKDIMPHLIDAGLFTKDHRAGLPLRNILRELDEQELLHLIPLLRVERKNKNRMWYFSATRHR